MVDDIVKISRRDKVLEVVLDRPPANAVDAETSRELGKVFEFFRDDSDLRVAIVTGAGEKFFCAGWDLQAVVAGGIRDQILVLEGLRGCRNSLTSISP